MPSNYTQNYQLNQWVATDQVKRTDFNADNAKIDAALSQKAEAAALSALTQVVAGKGNCCVVTGQYTGTGMRGVGPPCTLTFDHKPLVLLVANSNVMISARGGGGFILHNGSSSQLKVIWGDNSVSWYDDTIDAGPYRQMNTLGEVYTYVVLLEV